MFRQSLASTLILLAVFAFAPYQADNAFGADPADKNEYTIKLKKPGKGETIRYVEKETTTTKMTITGAQAKESDEVEKRDIRYTKSILDRPDGEKRPTKFLLTYAKYSVTKDGKAAETNDLVGKAVTAEKTDGIFKFQCAQKLTDADVEILNRKFNKPATFDNDDLVAKKAVKIGEEWVIDKAVIVKSFTEDVGWELDVNRSSATGRLMKAYKNEGRQFGVMEIKMILGIKEGPTKDGGAIEKDARFEVALTLDACIDGTLHSTAMKNKLRLLIKFKGPNGSVAIDSKGDQEESETEVAK